MINIFESTDLTKLPFKCSFLFLLPLLLNILPMPREGYKAQTRRSLCQKIGQSVAQLVEVGLNFSILGRQILPFPLPKRTPLPLHRTLGFPPKLNFIIVTGANIQIHIKTEGKWASLAKVNSFRGSRVFIFILKYFAWTAF